MWLHEQLRLIDHPAMEIERVLEYGGLATRSIRVSASPSRLTVLNSHFRSMTLQTLLVHMQHECKTLRTQVLEEERMVRALHRGGSMEHARLRRSQFVELEQQVVEAESATLVNKEVDHGVEE